MISILESITNIRIYILCSFILVWFFWNKKRINHRLVISILGVSLLNEVTTGLITVFNFPIHLNTNLYVVVNACLWFYVLHINFQKNIYIRIMIGYVCLSLINLLLFKGITNFNNTNFIIASIIYLIAFIIESNRLLIHEELDFFKSNNYLLLFAPVLFFIGFSFMLSFKSKDLITYVCFKDIKLYTLIGNFVNIIYYTLLNIYIYKERKLHD